MVVEELFYSLQEGISDCDVKRIMKTVLDRCLF